MLIFVYVLNTTLNSNNTQIWKLYPNHEIIKNSLSKNYTDWIINIENNINQGNSKYLIANSSILKKESISIMYKRYHTCLDAGEKMLKQSNKVTLF